MSVAYYIALETEIQGLHAFMNGYALNSADSAEIDGPTITQIAADLGVTPLIEFVSACPDEMLSLVDENDTLPEWATSLPDEEWFAPSDGLATVRALVNHLETHANVVPDQNDVVADLRQMVHILTAAETNHVRWHLAVDI